MLTLFKRSNGISYPIQTDKTGKRRWISTKQRSKKLALAQVTKLEKEPDAAKSLPLHSLIQEFISYASSFYTPGTVDIYTKSLNSFLKFTGNVDIATIGQRQIDDFTILRLKEVSPPTVSIELRSLRAVFYVVMK
jgi:hypothetical protein